MRHDANRPSAIPGLPTEPIDEGSVFVPTASLPVPEGFHAARNFPGGVTICPFVEAL
jgi:hypothetical protein